jgi:predicted negative regulator of RcsB-dependent stress response
MKDELPPMDPADDEERRSAAALARALDGGPAGPDLPQAALETAALLRLSAGVDQLGDERRAQIRRELLEQLARAPHSKPGKAARQGVTLPRWLLLAFPLAGAAALSLLVFVRGPEPTRLESDAAVDTSARPKRQLIPEKDEAPSAPAVTLGVPRFESAANAVADEATPSATERHVSMEAPATREAERSARAVPSVLERSGPVAARSGPGASARTPGDLAATGSSLADAPAANLAKRAEADGARQALVGLGKQAGERRAELLARIDDDALSGAHARLDGATSRAELERSQQALRGALDTLGSGLDPTDARLVRQDVYCRLAETALRLGEPRAALEWTRRGLDLDGPPTPFLAQLMALEGDAWAALGDDASAATSYMRALQVHEALLDESLDGR